MTIIALKDGIMAADSHVFSGGTHWPAASPKITRGPQGLIGIAGSIVDCWMVAKWWELGGRPQPVGDPPVNLLLKGPDGISAVILKNDGSAWYMDERCVPIPTVQPTVIGQEDAATFCEGALYAGLSAEDAVRLAIKHCKSAGGEVQVERLLPNEPKLETWPAPPPRTLAYLAQG
jgi:hypothetical protein